MIDLTTRIGKQTLRNPVTVASGTFGSLDEYAAFVDYNRLGAIVTKSVTLEPCLGNPMPRICETASGMLNAIGLENKGIGDFLENKIPFFKTLKVPLIVSIAGRSVHEYVEMAKRLEKETTVWGLELNISCPNVGESGKHRGDPLEFGVDGQATRSLVQAVREVFSRVLITKLSPHAVDITVIAKAAVDSGSDALAVMNTIKGMAVDLETRQPRLANVTGGLSGPAIKPIALRLVYEVKKALPKVPVMAMGGIMTAQDALEFLLVGAHAVAVGTAHFVNPKAAIEVLEGIEEYFQEKGYKSVEELRGKLRV